MDYLMFINQIARYVQQPPEMQLLVSGNDSLVQKKVIDDVISGSHKRGNALIIIDDTETIFSLETVSRFGYQIVNGMSGEYCLYNPFHITTAKGISRIRQLLTILGYDECRKGKVISYLKFIQYVEALDRDDHDFELTMESLGGYCTTIAVEEKLQQLLEEEIISDRQRDMLLRKYSECAGAGADLEDLFYLLMPYADSRAQRLDMTPGQAVVFKTGELGEDENAKRLVMYMIQFGLEEMNKTNITVVIFDKGYGERKGVLSLVKSLTPKVQMHLFSNDIFAIGDAVLLSTILNRFSVHIYSQHLIASSAEYIEKACGEIDIAKYQKTTTYDRRWGSNKPWDIFLGKNKTEAYTELTPVREPRYRKEMIMSFSQGSGIVEFMGNTSIFSI